MKTLDSYLVVIIFVISFLIRIWNISIPDCVVFDEFHFGQFINDYIHQDFFFDIHPPFGKLLYFLFAKFTCYDGSLSFENPNSQYSNEFFVFFRIVPAILASFVPEFIYLILRNSSISIISSFFTSLFISFEMSIISQSRFILIEGIQHFFICFHLLILTFTKNLGIIGVSLGFSISIKMTSFSLLPFTFSYIFISNVQHQKNKNIFESIKHTFTNVIIIFLIAFAVFISLTMIHLKLLKNVTNDAYEFLPDNLFNDIFANKTGISYFIQLFKNSLQITFLMNEINQKNKQIHPYSDSPLNWPLLTGIWVGMWSDETNSRQVNCFGNFFVYFFSFLGLIKRLFQIIEYVSKSCNDKKKLIDHFLNIKINVASFSFFGWIFSYFPFFLVKRALFLYHYQISLIFAVINFGFVTSNSIISGICLLLSLFGFCYWKPLLYGTFLTENELKEKVWIRRWRYGNIHHQKLIESFFEDFQF